MGLEGQLKHYRQARCGAVRFGLRNPPMTLAAENIETRRKRLLWRASHRGIKEMDLILGGFARTRIGSLDEAQLGELEQIIELPDQELLSWATRLNPVPRQHVSALLLEILDFRP